MLRVCLTDPSPWARRPARTMDFRKPTVQRCSKARAARSTMNVCTHMHAGVSMVQTLLQVTAVEH